MARPKIFHGSHIPILVKVMSISDGPVLELGAGFFSTPLLGWLCRAKGREFVSYENNEKWCEALRRNIGFHPKFVKNWGDIKVDDTHWSVAFIDLRPGIRRKVCANRLKDNADYIVIHDSEPDINKFYRYTDIYPLFKYRYNYTKVRPNTVVLSNFKDLKNL